MRLLQEEEEERQMMLQKSLETSESGIINLEGKLDKRSPATKMWQNRYFKVTTKLIPNAARDVDTSGAVKMDYFYSLIWFKKKGGAALKDVDTRFISGMSLMQSSRKVCYDPGTMKCELLLGSPVSKIEVREQGGADFDAQQPTVGTAQLINLATGSTTVTYFSFSIHTNKDMDDEGGAGGGGGKEKDILLRTKSVDDLIEWMNTIAQTARLVYDARSGMWCRSNGQVAQVANKLGSASLGDGKPSWADEAAEDSDQDSSLTPKEVIQQVNNAMHEHIYYFSTTRITNHTPVFHRSYLLLVEGLDRCGCLVSMSLFVGMCGAVLLYIVCHNM